MLDNSIDSIFNIPYSLPSNTHSIAIATRRPTAGYTQLYKYMPDYGGILEVPGSKCKNNGLNSSLLFAREPKYVRLVSQSNEVIEGAVSDECLAVACYLDSGHFSTIRAVGKTLYFNAAQKLPYDCDAPPTVQESISYAHVPYSYDIKGLKHNLNSNDHVIVKFNQGVKLLKLNKSFELPARNSNSSVHLPEQAAMEFVGSFPSSQGFRVSDACLNANGCSPFPKITHLNIASCDGRDLQVRIYDLNRPELVQKVVDSLYDDSTQITNTRITRRRTRSYVPLENKTESIEQLDKDPSHLFNMFLTTSHRVASVDPRKQALASIYVDKNKLASVLPGEKFKQAEYSMWRDHQFYLLSSMKLRVIDTRFPSNPVNTVDHQLGKPPFESINMGVIKLGNNKEIICMSCFGRLHFITFGEPGGSQDARVTPRSLHQIFVEPSPVDYTGDEADELVGLRTTSQSIFNAEQVLFSVLQLSKEGDVCIRGYSGNDESESGGFPTRAEAIVRSEKSRKIRFRQPCNLDIEDRDVYEPSVDNIEGATFLDVTNTSDIDEAEANLVSKRAAQKCSEMRQKLQ